MGSAVVHDSPEVHVLGWDQPLPAAAAEWFAEGWSGKAALDLSDSLIVVPTRQSGRRLREALAAHAAKFGQAVFPPQVVQPEQVLDLARPPGAAQPATRADLLLAWVRVVQAADLDEFRAVFPIDPPQRSFGWALQLGEDLVRLQETLAEAALRFQDVTARAGSDFAEAERWQQLADLEGRCDLELARAHRIAPGALHQQTALAPAPPPPGIKRLVLLATADPRVAVLRVVKQWLRQVHVTVALYADAELREHFDEWGRPRPAYWGTVVLPWTAARDQIHLRSDPSDQALWVGDWASRATAAGASFALGCADPELVPRVAGALEAAGLSTYLPQGRTLREDPLVALLEGLAAAVWELGWEAVSALFRQPAVLDWLARVEPDFQAAKWLAELDELQARHLPASLDRAIDHAAEWPQVAPALRRMQSLLNQLREGSFPAAWDAALRELFAERILDTSRAEDAAFAEAAEAWRTTAQAVAEASRSDLSGTDAMRFTLRLLGAQRRFDEKPAGAVDLDGWLELLFRPEPHVVVTGFNDGSVPEAIVGHAFLPESLRQSLGLRTNEQRFARDTWQLAALLASRGRDGRVDVTLGKVSASGDPLRPSRLLFRCSDAELPRRVAHLFRNLPPSAELLPWNRGWQLKVPVQSAPERIRVTGFRDYLRCPFRFYLKHVLKLEAVDAAKRELDAGDFGELVHRVLERLGRDPEWRDCTNDRDLAFAFAAELDRLVAARFGSELSLPLVVQVESARQRLAHATQLQAATRADGWIIQHVEWRFPEGQLNLGGVAVRGTIDRIERHERTGAWRVLDYKTSETAIHPASAHLRSLRTSAEAELVVDEALFTGDDKPKRWLDLQLPLYRWAVTETLGAQGVAVGYFNLPKAISETAITMWEPEAPEVQEAAMRCAAAVAGAVAQGRFWPPADDLRFDDFAALFHDGTAASVICDAALTAVKAR